jgi:SHS2 domain-containing protein
VGREGVKRYRTIDHTADLGLHVWGRTPAELFVHAAEGMCALYFRLSAVRPRQRRTIVAAGHDREEVLVDWLRQILYGIEVDRFLPRRFAVVRLEETGLEGEIWGEPYDPARHRWRTGIKAVTYHDLRMVLGGGGVWEVRIIFDT